MTPKRRLAVLLGSLAVLVLTAGVVLLSVWPEREEDPEEPEASPREYLDLVKENAGDVTGVTFVGQNGSYTLRRDREGALTLESPEPLFPGKDSEMRRTFNYAINLSYLTPIVKDADDGQLAQFGLDKPALRWTVSRADGTSAELMLGVQSPTGTGRYARRDNERAVFLLSRSQSEALMKTARELSDLSFLPDAGGEETPAWSTITRCLIEKEDGAVELLRRSDEEMAEAVLGTSVYRLTRPHGGEGNDHLIQTTVLEPVAAISPAEIVESAPDDLTGYGLDDPVRLTVETADWSGVLLIGSFDGERGGRYVMREGVDAVLLDTEGSYAFLNADYPSLRSSLVWLSDIEDVASVTYEMDGRTRQMTLEHRPEDADEPLRAWLDGEEMTVLNARRLYKFTLLLTQDGGSEAEPSGEPPYRFVMTFSDGGTETLELYPINDRQYLIVFNGENMNLFISRSSLLNNLLNKFDLLDKGGDLPQF